MTGKNTINEKLVENLTDEQLNELLAYTPAFSKDNLANIKAHSFEKVNSIAALNYTSPKKKFFTKKLVSSVAAAVMLLIMSTVVFAAITDFDLGHIFNSFFNNPAVNIIDVNQTAVDNGIEITFIYAYTDGNQIYAMIAMRDLESNRLDENMMLLSEIPNHSFAVSTPIIYDETRGRFIMGISIIPTSDAVTAPIGTGTDFSFSIKYILSGIVHDFGTSGNYEAFNLGETYFYLVGATVDEVITGSWAFTFPINVQAERVFFTAEIRDSLFFERFSAEISPMVTNIRLTIIGGGQTASDYELMQSYFYFRRFEVPFITLNDGSKAELFDWGFTFAYPSNELIFTKTSLYLDISQVYSITVLGVEHLTNAE